jgi:hypothetical protein
MSNTNPSNPKQSHLWLFVSTRCYPAIAEQRNGLGPDADVIALDSGISSFLKTRLAGVIVSALLHLQGTFSFERLKANTIWRTFHWMMPPGEFDPLDCISKMLGALLWQKRRPAVESFAWTWVQGL